MTQVFLKRSNFLLKFQLFGIANFCGFCLDFKEVRWTEFELISKGKDGQLGTDDDMSSQNQ